MRVLLISHTCQSRSAGQPKAEYLSRMPDVQLRVLVPDRWMEYGQWKKAQLPINSDLDLRVGKVYWPWAGPAQWYAHWYPRMASILRQFQPDVIDLWEEPYGLVSAHTCWLRNQLLPHAKIVAETEQNINKNLPPPFEQFRSYTLRNANFAVGRNREAIEILRDKGYSGEARVVPNAVDAELFRPLDRVACRAKLMAEIGLTTPPAFLAGYVGRLVEEKGLADLLNALQFLPSDFHVLLVGNGPFEDELRRQASALNKDQQIHFLPARSLDTLPAVMNALDAFVLPSRTTPSWKEQFGRVIIEAQACRTPVIGTQSGAIPDVIGEGGLAVPESAPEALAAALKTLADNPQQCAAMGMSGRQQVEESYTWEQVARNMKDVYQTVLSTDVCSKNNVPVSQK
jgi:glycosyltransferase involved in cell wall biosynthesis